MSLHDILGTELLKKCGLPVPAGKTDEERRELHIAGHAMLAAENRLAVMWRNGDDLERSLRELRRGRFAPDGTFRVHEFAANCPLRVDAPADVLERGQALVRAYVHDVLDVVSIARDRVDAQMTGRGTDAARQRLADRGLLEAAPSMGGAG